MDEKKKQAYLGELKKRARGSNFYIASNPGLTNILAEAMKADHFTDEEIKQIIQQARDELGITVKQEKPKE